MVCGSFNSVSDSCIFAFSTPLACGRSFELTLFLSHSKDESLTVDLTLYLDISIADWIKPTYPPVSKLMILKLSDLDCGMNRTAVPCQHRVLCSSSFKVQFAPTHKQISKRFSLSPILSVCRNFGLKGRSFISIKNFVTSVYLHLNFVYGFSKIV